MGVDGWRKLEVFCIAIGVVVTAGLGVVSLQIARALNDIAESQDHKAAERAAVEDFLVSYQSSPCEKQKEMMQDKLDRWFGEVNKPKDETPECHENAVPWSVAVRGITVSNRGADNMWHVTGDLLIDLAGDSDENVADVQLFSIMKVKAKPGVDQIDDADDLLLVSLNEVRLPKVAGAEVGGSGQAG